MWRAPLCVVAEITTRRRLATRGACNGHSPIVVLSDYESPLNRSRPGLSSRAAVPSVCGSMNAWSSPGLMDTQLSPSKMGFEGVFSAQTESKAEQTAEVHA
jgi:hypothetical protein